MQFVLPSRLENAPATHAVHTAEEDAPDIAAAAYEPAPQAVQAEVPEVRALKVPAAQATQPAPCTNVPAGHDEAHTADVDAPTTALYAPAAQEVHPEAAVTRSLYNPEAHGKHMAPAVYEPVVHAVHTLEVTAPIAEADVYRPVEQTVQFAEPAALLYIPATHTVHTMECVAANTLP